MSGALHRLASRMLLAAWLATGGIAAWAQGASNPPLPVTRITAGMHVIQAEVAATPGERMLGLMNRPSLAPNAGMLFVFERPGVHCFWMRNTRIPLSIAFVDDDGSIVNIADMEPFDEASNHCPAKPVRYALEMNRGWFAKRGILAGARLRADALFGASTDAGQAGPR
jgi:uncharacterized membrane protein (UPF0127 family)